MRVWQSIRLFRESREALIHRYCLSRMRIDTVIVEGVVAVCWGRGQGIVKHGVVGAKLEGVVLVNRSLL